MCNFHEAVAVKAATDSSGNIHQGYKAVIRVALSRYRVEQYVDDAEVVNGYNPYPLSTCDQQAAFQRSGLVQLLQKDSYDQERNLEFLRNKIVELGQLVDLSTKGLNLPIATARESFLNMVIDSIYMGDPKKNLSIAGMVDERDLQPIYRAVSWLHADLETSRIMEQLVQGTICTLYEEAPHKANRMLVNAYESMPLPLRNASAGFMKYSGNLFLGGFSGLVGHGIHYGSVLGSGLVSGLASTTNYALSGAFLMASYGGWHYLFGGKYKSTGSKIKAFSAQAAFTLIAMAGAALILQHDHTNSAQAEWYYSMPDDMRKSMTDRSRETYESLPEDLRDRLDISAKAQGVPPEVLLIICNSTDPVMNDISVYFSTKNSQNNSFDFKK